MAKFKPRRAVEVPVHIEAPGLHMTAKRTEIASASIDKPTGYFALVKDGTTLRHTTGSHACR